MSAGSPNRFGFVDRALPDGAVERAYSNGRVERRTWDPAEPAVVAWSDNVGNQGRDRDLGGGRVERADAHGNITIGQGVGHGITVWGDSDYVTVNETPLPEPPPPPPARPGGFAGLLVALGLGDLLGFGGAAPAHAADDPAAAEALLYDELAMQQEAARRAARQGQASSHSSGDGGGDGGDSDWDNDNGGDDNGVDSFG